MGAAECHVGQRTYDHAGCRSGATECTRASCLAHQGCRHSVAGPEAEMLAAAQLGQLLQGGPGQPSPDLCASFSFVYPKPAHDTAIMLQYGCLEPPTKFG